MLLSNQIKTRGSFSSWKPQTSEKKISVCPDTTQVFKNNCSKKQTNKNKTNKHNQKTEQQQNSHVTLVTTVHC